MKSKKTKAEAPKKPILEIHRKSGEVTVIDLDLPNETRVPWKEFEGDVFGLRIKEV